MRPLARHPPRRPEWTRTRRRRRSPPPPLAGPHAQRYRVAVELSFCCTESWRRSAPRNVIISATWTALKLNGLRPPAQVNNAEREEDEDATTYADAGTLDGRSVRTERAERVEESSGSRRLRR